MVNDRRDKQLKILVSKREYFIILSEANADELTLNDYIRKKIGIEFNELDLEVKVNIKHMPIGEIFRYEDIKSKGGKPLKDRLTESKLVRNYIKNSYFAVESKEKCHYMRFK